VCLTLAARVRVPHVRLTCASRVPPQISEEMHLYPPYISKSCYIQSCCATSGEGLHEGLDWLSSNMPEDKT
jgi:hypothetical protein